MVDIVLVTCDDVTNSDGTVSFDGTNPGGTGNAATWTEANSFLTVVNGQASNVGDDVDSADGTVTFTVEGVAAECFNALVFGDDDNDNTLNLGADGQPTDEFGVSDDTTVVFGEAADGAVTAGTITDVNTDANYFATDNNETFYYDDNDELQVENAADVCTTVTMAEFETVLSVGDQLSGTFYRTDEANQSILCIDDVAPTAVTGVGTQAPSGDDAGEQGIEVVWTESSTATVVSYDVYRAEAVQPTVTGGTISCPDTDDFALIGSVADENDGTNKFVDNNVALEDTAGDPTYCYFVVSVDESGDESVESDVVSDTAYAGDTSAEPEFSSASVEEGTFDVVVNYDEDIQSGTVDTNASNYQITLTRGGVSYALDEDAAVATGTTTNTVTITVVDDAQTPFQAGDTVLVTAVTGDDGDTVLDVTDVAQPVGDAVQATTADTTPATIQSAVADENTNTVTAMM